MTRDTPDFALLRTDMRTDAVHYPFNDVQEPVFSRDLIVGDGRLNKMPRAV